MTDNITNDGARDLFASFREPAWHSLGNVFSHEVTDSREMLDLAGLSGWNVREHDVAALTLDGTEMLDAEFVVPAQAIVATIGGVDRVLGVTGKRYEIVQNEESFSFLQSLHDGARWETAGAIKGGRVVFGSMAFDRDFVLDPTGVADLVKSYLLVHTSHDGSTGLGGGVTPVRVVCQNTLNAAMGSIKQTFKIRHTKNVQTRMDAEKALWRQANTYMDAFEKEAQTLYATPASDKEYFGIVEDMFPRPEKDAKGSVKKWETRQETFAQAWNGKPNAGIKNTAWGVFNALTEANQWGRNQRQGDKGAENFFAAGAGFDIPTNAFRAQAFAAAKSLVGA
jgi:phage/plasmid-like protein (TIGR03299 family)